MQNRFFVTFIITVFVVAGGIIFAATDRPFMGLASFNYFLFCLGLSFTKKDRRIHARIMSSAILLDLALVLVLQFQREAIQTAISFTMSPLQQVHVFSSFSATALYIPTLILGVKILNNPTLTRTKKVHKRIALAAFTFRTLGFFLMFSLISYYKN